MAWCRKRIMRVMQIINFESDEGDIDESDVGNE